MNEKVDSAIALLSYLFAALAFIMALALAFVAEYFLGR